jgi:2-phospho-L-lactate guanylyltransferase
VATVAILPVKRFAQAKQRLEPALGAGSREALAFAMFADVLGALEHSTLVEKIVVVSGETAVKNLVSQLDVILIRDSTEKGQSKAALAGMARAAALGYESAVLIPGDTPLLDPLELDNLIANAAVGRFDVVIVPDRHGTGTNALLLDPAGSYQPQFGPRSLERHTEQAESRGLNHTVEHVPSLALDIDTGADLAELVSAFEQHRGRAPRTQGVLRQIERSRQRPTPA